MNRKLQIKIEDALYWAEATMRNSGWAKMSKSTGCYIAYEKVKKAHAIIANKDSKHGK